MIEKKRNLTCDTECRGDQNRHVSKDLARGNLADNDKGPIELLVEQNTDEGKTRQIGSGRELIGWINPVGDVTWQNRVNDSGGGVCSGRLYGGGGLIGVSHCISGSRRWDGSKRQRGLGQDEGVRRINGDAGRDGVRRRRRVSGIGDGGAVGRLREGNGGYRQGI